MADAPDADGRVATAAEAAPKRDPKPKTLEQLRLAFEVELLTSQNAGAALDPLFRQARKGQSGS